MTGGTFTRRRFLEVASLSSAVLAGCTGTDDSGDSTPTDTAITTPETEPPTPIDTASPTASPTPRDHPDVIFVSPGGRDSNDGTVEAPLSSIQAGLERAQAGQTVHALPGRYHELVRTVRPGEPGKPITITGPPDAVFVGGDQTPNPEPMEIMHSHVHVTGLTFDGLQYPDRSDELSSYAKANVSVDPIGRVEEGEEPPYVSDVVISPHAVGNTRGNCIHVFFGDGVEVGEFRHAGPSGVAHFVFDEPGHDGEIVYIGTAPHGWEDRWGGRIDRTRNVHVHHIDASAGHKHAELADAKVGTEDVMVEYCTSVDTFSKQPAIHLGGENGIARWNRIEGANRNSITVGNWGSEYDEIPEAATGNAVYGNHISGSGGRSIHLTPEVDPDANGPFCGNTVEQPSPVDVERACPDDVPSGDGVGHTGGNSPWT